MELQPHTRQIHLNNQQVQIRTHKTQVANNILVVNTVDPKSLLLTTRTNMTLQAVKSRKMNTKTKKSMLRMVIPWSTRVGSRSLQERKAKSLRSIRKILTITS